MVARLPRLLLAFSSSLMAFGGTMHALAFHRTLSAIAASKLAPFFGNTLKLLWLGDSATMFVLAAIFGLLAVRPAVATRPLVLLVALVPAATAVLIYVFLGNFFAGHLQLATAAAAFSAGLRFSRNRSQSCLRPNEGVFGFGGKQLVKEENYL